MPSPNQTFARTIDQRANSFLVQRQTSSSEKTVTTFARGLVDQHNNVVIAVVDGVLVNGDGTAILIYGEPIAISNVTGLQAVLDSINSDIASLNSSFSTLNSTVTSLSSQVSTNTGAINTINATISTYGNSVTRNVGTTTGTVAAGDDSRFTVVDAHTPGAYPYTLALTSRITVINAAVTQGTTRTVTISGGSDGDSVILSVLGAGTGGAITLTDGTYSRTLSSLRSADHAELRISRQSGAWNTTYVTVNGQLDSTTRQVFTVSLSTNDDHKDVTFTVPFSGSPKVHPWITIPSGGSIIECAVDNSTITSSGCTVQFGATIPASGYILNIDADL